MNIAAITITYNDDYKLNEWYKHYLEYKDELYLHIIIDNNSDNKYYDKLVHLFNDSKIIKRHSNGGCTMAYNDGINYALSRPEVDAIMLIGNDIKFSHGHPTKLYDFLYSNSRYGMVEPIILAKDSDIIEDFGCEISSKLFLKPAYIGKEKSILIDSFRVVDAVTGGMNLSKRKFYEEVGLQDTKLFMYSDEVDMGIRAEKKGFKMAVTKDAIAWHQHINPTVSSMRLPYTSYLMGRNKVYLANKHFGTYRMISQMGYHFFLFMKGFVKNIFNKDGMSHQLSFIRGSWNGFIGNMSLVGIIEDFMENENSKGL
ncbi:MAG: glycosyltransferase family 2 protein [Bacteroidales bacterium]